MDIRLAKSNNNDNCFMINALPLSRSLLSAKNKYKKISVERCQFIVTVASPNAILKNKQYTPTPYRISKSLIAGVDTRHA